MEIYNYKKYWHCEKVLSLYRAAERGDIDAVMSLLSHAECEVDAVDEASQHTALHVACEKGFITIVKLLLDAGASLQSCRYYQDCGDGYPVLHMAATGGSAAIVELLVQRGADVHSLAYGCTALHDSCQYGHWEAASVLLKSGSDVNAADAPFGTPLHYATMNGSEEIVKLLLSCGANFGAVNTLGRTALHCAWECENNEVAELLIEMGCAFPSASKVHYDFREDVVRRLLNCEADLDARDGEGLTALQWSCRDKSPRIAECLLKSGADVNTVDLEGNTPMHFAIDDKNWRVGSRIKGQLVDLLLQWGGDVNATDSVGLTPLTEYFSFDYDDDNDEQVISKLFARHVAMMQAHNLFVNDCNLQALSDNEPLQEFITACRDEIENMRKTFIGDSSVTFFNIFTKGSVRLSDYMANESIQHAFESSEFERVFPIYAENLTRQFVHGWQRLGLIRKTDSVLNASDLRCVPYVCMRHLKRCLSNDDLKLILQCETTTETK